MDILFSRVRFLALFAVVLIPLVSQAAPKKTEAELLAMLKSPEPQKVIDALDRLPNLYPNSTTAVQEIRGLLGTRTSTRGFPSNIITRKAARALGNYGATLGDEDIQVFLKLIRSASVDDVMDGLKALRGLKQPVESEQKIAAEVTLLLKDKEIHVVRDAIRTLGALGNKDTIPVLEPFLKHSRVDVKSDARAAIALLQKKTAK
jgi:HEAT repeat protein